jgi:drug/metabolite transporter (DMT)-like permease
MTRLGPLGRRPVLAGTAGALTIAFSAILVRLADVSPSTAAVFRCAYALPPLALLAVWERRRYGPRTRADLRLGVVAGAFFAADLIFWHHSIGDVGAGLATVLANLQVVFVGLVAWAVLAERPERHVLAAVPVVLIGVVLVSGVVGKGAYGDDPALGVVFGVLTALAYSGFILVLRQGNMDIRRPAGPLFDATLAATVFAAIAGAAVGELELTPGWPSVGWLVTLALTSQVLGWLLISISLPRLPAVVTSLLLMVQPVGSMILGAALLSEQPSAVQVLGVVVILAGLAIATLGGRARRPVQVPQAAGPAAGQPGRAG